MNLSGSTQMRWHAGHCWVALGYLLIETAIALWVNDAFVRPYLGDVLVVPLVYHAVAACLRAPVGALAFGVLLFAFSVELAQYFRLLSFVGLESNTFARVILGAHFSAWDLVAYTVGAALSVGEHLWLRRRNVLD